MHTTNCLGDKLHHNDSCWPDAILKDGHRSSHCHATGQSHGSARRNWFWVGGKEKTLDGTHRFSVMIAFEQFTSTRAAIADAAAYRWPVVSAAPSTPDQRLVRAAI